MHPLNIRVTSYILGIHILFSHLTSAQGALDTNNKPSTSTVLPAVFDIKPILRATDRRDIHRLKGSPSSSEICCSTDNGPKFVIEQYPWGEVQYDHSGRVQEITYRFDTRIAGRPGRNPQSVEEAVEMVGLAATSGPARVGW